MLTMEHRKKIKYLSQYKYLNKEIERKIKQLGVLWRGRIGRRLFIMCRKEEIE